MGAQGYIGRAPGESSVVVARQTFTPTGITTNFTFASGYTVGYVDAYLNGARLIEGDDYTATDGSVVGLTTHAINGDVLELVAYKAFNVSNVTGTLGDFSVPDKIVHTDDLDTAIRFPQVDTFTVETAGSEVFRVDANGNVGIGTTNTLAAADPKNQSILNVGVVTANSVTAAAGTFSSLNVSGTLTYDDVTNVDAVGYSTFREGINVQGAGSTTTTLNVSGVTTMTDDANFGSVLNIDDAIVHSGDSNTKIRFPAADTFTVETGGSERFRIDSSGNTLIYGVLRKDNVNSSLSISGGNGADSSANIVLHGSGGSPANVIQFRTGSTERVRIASNGDVGIGTDDPNRELSVYNDSNAGVEIKSSTTGQSSIFFTDIDDTNIGMIGYFHTDDSMFFRTNDAERLRITSAGNVGIGTTIPGGKLQIDGGELLVGTKTVKNVASTTNATAIFRDDAGSHTIIAVESNSTFGGGTIALSASRNNTDNGFTILQDGDVMGEVRFAGDDGTDLQHSGARIRAEVDGTPAEDDMPGALIFLTNPGGSVTTERLRISANGNIGIGGITGSKPLHVRADGEDYPLLLQNRTNSTSTCGMALIATGSDFSDGQFASIEALSGGVGSTQHELQFKTCSSGGTPTNRFTIRHDGNIRIPADNKKLQIGASEDFELYHDGTDNVIQTDGPNIRIGTSGENFAKFINNGAAELYHDNSKMFETTSTGALVQRPSGDVSLSIGDTSNSDGHLVLTAKSSSIELHGRSNHPINILFNTVQKASIGIDGTFSDSIGPLRRLGQNIKSGNYTLVATDAGKHVRVDGNHTITVPDNVFTAGDMITIVANSSSDVPITQGSGLNLYNASDGTTGNKTLAARTVCTILFAEGGSSAKAYIAGGGLS